MASDNHRRPPGAGALSLALVYAALLLAPVALADEVGAIRGTVLDRDFGTPLAGVRVSVVGLSFGATTGPDGTFLIDRVPVGRHALAFALEGYERATAPDVIVLAGQLADVQVELSAEVFEMEEFLVTGR